MKNRRVLLAAALAALLLSISVYYFCYYLKPNGRTLLIGGSSTVHHYTQVLAESYMEQNRDTQIVNESGGSTPGLIAIKNGAIDIASMSRDLADNEDDEFTKNYLIGKDAVGIVVHPSNPIANLTTSQIEGIYSGAIDNWSQVGGSDSPILVVTRTPESTTLKGLNEIVLKGTKVAGSATVTGSAQEMAEKVAGDPNAIGFLALRDLGSGVKALTVNNVQMSRETILTDRYPISRSFYYVVYDMPNGDPASEKQLSLLEKIMGLFKMDDRSAQKMRTDTSWTSSTLPGARRDRRSSKRKAP
jgi:phosphate transport system substrate-binding protein